MKDGRTKDWWIGYLLGCLEVFSIRKDIPPDAKESAYSAVKQFKDWELMEGKDEK